MAYSKIKVMRLFKWEYSKRSGLKALFICLLIYCLSCLVHNFIAIRYKYKYCYDDFIINGVPDVLNEYEDPPPKGRSIFFHETSCNFAENKVISITPRQACAVESAAIHNPNSTVYLLYASPIRFPNATEILTNKFSILNELFKYKNIKIRRVFLNSYVKNTPLEEWYLSGQLKYSYYLNSHTSDVLRFLSLWKFGGTYMDLDIIVLKDLENLPHNYAGAEDLDSVAAGIINFDHENNGHEIAELCLKEIYTNFKGDDWGHNGPGVLTRVLQEVCRVKKTISMNPQKCNGFTVYKPLYFYPIHWKNWKLFFDPDKLISAFNIIRNAYIIHVWNKFSSGTDILTREKDVAYGALARTHCPNVFRESRDIF